MTLKQLTLGGFMGVALALAPACGDSGGGESSTETDPGTSAAPTTDSGTTGQTPTEGTASEGTTTAEGTDSGTSEPTTGDVSDPEILQKCNDGYTNDEMLQVAQCPCAVALGGYPDEAECLADINKPDPALSACTCEVYSRYPDIEASLDCVAPALATAITCVMGAMCTDSPEPLFECLQPYFDAIETCAEPPKAALAEVEITCNMAAPFMCTSGETIPDIWKCNYTVDCMDASDENTCPDTFMCADGTEYVPEGFKCDAYPDCTDGSDEVDCPTFMCMDGGTIPEQFKCNGNPDCEDASDEGSMAGCPVFMCMSGAEIPLDYKCDGFPDCDDESDEGDAAMCPVFMCMNGMTIPEAFKCNGFPECDDESDESDCPEFMCDNGMILPGFVECDGFPDCEDGSDETDCP